jgi:hypothetical protein
MVCELCGHLHGEHTLAMGLISDIPTYRYCCVHIENGQVCDCTVERQEVIEVEGEPC